MARRMGAGTIRLERASAIAAVAAVGSRLEQEGPLGAEFDRTVEDSSFGEKSWEKAETKMQQLAMELALQKGQTAPEQVDVVLGGDLLTQCIASAYAVRELERPFLGLYGACSTMAESLTLAALLVESGAAEKALAVTSSHFCSSERQLRRGEDPDGPAYRYGLRGGLGWKAGEHSHRGSLHWPGGGPGGHRPE